MNQISYQLVPPGTHHKNAAEQAIQTYKNHFKIVFSTWSLTSHYKYGIASSHMPKFHSIQYNNNNFIHNYQHNHTSMELTVKILLLWPYPGPNLSPTINWMQKIGGHHMTNQDGILDQQWNIIFVVDFTSTKQQQLE